MIDNASNPVAWVLLTDELAEAREHLDDLLTKMVSAGEIDEEIFRVNLGHVYAHLNRAWHSRNHEAQITDDQWPKFSQFPIDVPPVG